MKNKIHFLFIKKNKNYLYGIQFRKNKFELVFW